MRDKKNHEDGKDVLTSKRARSDDEMALDEHTKKKSRIDEVSKIEKKLLDEDREQRAEEAEVTRDQREPEKDARIIEEPIDLTMEEEDTEETIQAKVQKVLDVRLGLDSNLQICLVNVIMLQ